MEIRGLDRRTKEAVRITGLWWAGPCGILSLKGLYQLWQYHPFTLRPQPLGTVMSWKVPMLVGLIVLGTHIWTINKEFLDITKDLDYFVASVEFAVAQFNDNNPEENTYRLLEVGRAQKKVSPCAQHYPLMKSLRLGLGVDQHQQGLVRRELDLQNTLHSRI